MRDLIPEGLRKIIRDRYIAGVADAEALFEYNEEDEDALTGALGQAMSTSRPTEYREGDEVYHWKIYSRKIRGRGAKAPEKKLGADGIFQIEVLDPRGNVVRNKGLLFQAKKGWSAADRNLVKQARSMLNEAGEGIVIDYGARGYTACAASDVIRADGRKSVAVKDGAVRPLGQTLGNEFLDCSIGKIGLFYDPETGTVQRGEPGGPVPHRAITTSIVRVRRSGEQL